jgi:hypothetical protein
MSMPHVIKHKASLKSPDLNNMITPFSKSGFWVLRFRDSCCRVSCLFNLRNPKCRNTEIFGRPPPQLYHVSRLREFQNKEPQPLVFENTEMRTPMRSTKAGFQQDFSSFQSFGLRTSRILMQGSQLFNLQNPEMVNKV